MIRRILLALLLTILAYGVWWLFLRSPEQQILAAQEHFLAVVEDRDWEKVKDTFASDFATFGGMNRDSIMPELDKALNGFVTLDIEARETTIQASRDQGVCRQVIRVTGLGSQIAIAVRDRANQLRSPCIFHWRKTGGWPWQWQLTQVHHDEL
ncbi:MAG: hypothetical protein IPK32_25780 [Verrucomicrobiaceae bacterium]|nr:hypothetical protein [Verrucomicrobiaceae bacterium]